MKSDYSFDPKNYQKDLLTIVAELLVLDKSEPDEDRFKQKVEKVLKRHPKDGSRLFRRDQLIAGIKWMMAGGVGSGEWEVGKGLEFRVESSGQDQENSLNPQPLTLNSSRNQKQVTRNVSEHRTELITLSHRLKMKPMRTESGVTTVTVLTKPFACPGKCIFCPNDVRMPKSYIATEPGAQRAIQNRFSPYLQVWNRLQALKNIGHPTEKIELLVLGGTWSYYPEKYQIWFVSECFRAMNAFGVAEGRMLNVGGGGEEVGSRKLEGKVVNFQIPSSNFQESIENQKTEISNSSRNQKPETRNLFRPQNPEPSTYQRDDANFLYSGSKPDIQKYFASDWNDELRAKVGDLPYNKLILTKEFKEHFSQFIVSEDSALSPKLGWIELEKLHEINSHSNCRCVGLVLETRPDSVTPREALRMRKLGATKVQLGIQTLDDEVSKLNKRGEGRTETSRSFQLLRAAGFKIHAHMMPNLFGATPEIDLKSYYNLFHLLEYKPDEVKIYPTSTIKFTELHELYEKGEYKPYDTETLVDLMAKMLEMTPEYCRLSRIIRDIPSTEIEAGNKTTNLREVVEHKLKKENRTNPNIRAREIRDKKVKMEDLHLDIIEYETAWANEYFLQYITKERRIAGFLRLSLPKNNFQVPISNFQKGEELLRVARNDVQNTTNYALQTTNCITPELNNCAMIREVHVYGPSLQLSKDSSGDAQHIGLGTKLIEKAKEIAKEKNFGKLAVISAIGTREYYDKRGFKLDKYYQIAEL